MSDVISYDVTSLLMFPLVVGLFDPCNDTSARLIRQELPKLGRKFLVKICVNNHGNSLQTKQPVLLAQSPAYFPSRPASSKIRIYCTQRKSR